MRIYRLLIPILISAIAFAACSGGNGMSPTASMPAVGSAGPVSGDHSGTFSHGTIPISGFTESDPCQGGLDLTLGGSMKYRAYTVVGRHKTKVTVTTAFDGLTGIDSAGNTYTFKGHGAAQIEIPNGGFLHGVVVGRIVAVGSGPDAGLRVRFKVNIADTPSGGFSVTLDKIEIVCA